MKYQHYIKSWMMYVLYVLWLLLVSSFVFAQEAETDTAFLSNPEAALEVELWLDKRYADGRDVTYSVGQSIEIGMQVSSSSFVYLYNIHNDGTILQIYPNRFESANFLSPEKTLYFGIKGDNYHFKAAGPEGKNTFVAIASRQKLTTDNLAAFLTDNGIFALGYQSEESFKENLKSILEALKPADWTVMSVPINIRD